MHDAERPISELASEAYLEERKCMCCIACWSPLPGLRASAAFHIEHATTPHGHDHSSVMPSRASHGLKIARSEFAAGYI